MKNFSTLPTDDRKRAQYSCTIGALLSLKLPHNQNAYTHLLQWGDGEGKKYFTSEVLTKQIKRYQLDLIC